MYTFSFGIAGGKFLMSTICKNNCRRPKRFKSINNLSRRIFVKQLLNLGSHYDVPSVIFSERTLAV
jgi:hypothetical protein